MSELTGVERVSRQLNHQPVDRIAAAEEFWNFTRDRWVADGAIPPETDLEEHFGLDISKCWAFNLALHLRPDQILAEDEETTTFRNGNGATLRTYKSHASTPEHIDFDIKERADWLDRAKSLLTPDPARINFAAYREQKARAAQAGRFFCWSGVNVFESIHPVCGHENLLLGMALDPEWIKDMAETFAELQIQLLEILFEREGLPDGIWYYEDMGFKGRPFMSPEMYRELIMPSHRRTIDFAHGRGLKVIMHSCGFVEPLLPGMVEAGIDCLQAMEVKAGMDLLRIYRNFGDRIALMGGLDVRPVADNDPERIRRELESKIPIVKAGNAYILHTDHSIPESARYESYRYFLDLGRELGRY